MFSCVDYRDKIDVQLLSKSKCSSAQNVMTLKFKIGLMQAAKHLF